MIYQKTDSFSTWLLVQLCGIIFQHNNRCCSNDLLLCVKSLVQVFHQVVYDFDPSRIKPCAITFQGFSVISIVGMYQRKLWSISGNILSHSRCYDENISYVYDICLLCIFKMIYMFLYDIHCVYKLQLNIHLFS